MRARHTQKLASKTIFTKMGLTLLRNIVLASRKARHKAKTQIHQLQSTVLGFKMTFQGDRAENLKHLSAGKALGLEGLRHRQNHQSLSRNWAVESKGAIKNPAECLEYRSPKEVQVYSTASKALSKSVKLTGVRAAIESRSRSPDPRPRSWKGTIQTLKSTKTKNRYPQRR